MSYEKETCLIIYFIAIHFSYGSVDHPVQEKRFVVPTVQETITIGQQQHVKECLSRPNLHIM